MFYLHKRNCLTYSINNSISVVVIRSVRTGISVKYIFDLKNNIIYFLPQKKVPLFHEKIFGLQYLVCKTKIKSGSVRGPTFNLLGSGSSFQIITLSWKHPDKRWAMHFQKKKIKHVFLNLLKYNSVTSWINLISIHIL